MDELPLQWWFGTVVPKRHAKRAVTRTLLKRQIRCAMGTLPTREAALPFGLWAVRLKAPFDRKVYTSAASDALRQAAREELAELLQRAAPRRVVAPAPADRG